ncbi:MAG: hypothetical protein ABEH83_08765, partial [Halobacterium sp.]
MEVTGIDVYNVDLPIAEGTYDWAGGNSYATFDSTVLRLRTDGDHVGWGEVSMLGSAYLPAFGKGARAGVAELAPAV